MILNGNQRGGAKDLALHLMKDENEHIEVHELRGFVSQNLMGALNEAYAVSRGTKCRQFLYSLSLNPPPNEKVTTVDFEEAIDRAESRLKLTGQPRAIVFHEKEGRRHAHVVWSRIDVKSMKAVQMSYDHEKLQSLSRELFLEHEWHMPAGLAEKSLSDPRNFTLAEYQQAKRAGKDPRAIKTAFQDAWAISDSKAAFAHALEERGYRIARGDRRGFVAVDHQGEVYAIPKWAGIKTKQVRQRLGDENDLPSVAEAKEQIAKDMLPKLKGFQGQIEHGSERLEAAFEKRRQALIQRQQTERLSLKKKIEQRRLAETVERQNRFRRGLKGLWDLLRGEHQRTKKRNKQEAEAAQVRDRTEFDTLVFQHLDQRKHLNMFRLQTVKDCERERLEIEREIEAVRAFKDYSHDPPKPRRPRRRHGPLPER